MSELHPDSLIVAKNRKCIRCGRTLKKGDVAYWIKNPWVPAAHHAQNAPGCEGCYFNNLPSTPSYIPDNAECTCGHIVVIDSVSNNPAHPTEYLHDNPSCALHHPQEIPNQPTHDVRKCNDRRHRH